MKSWHVAKNVLVHLANWSPRLVQKNQPLKPSEEQVWSLNNQRSINGWSFDPLLLGIQDLQRLYSWLLPEYRETLQHNRCESWRSSEEIELHLKARCLQGINMVKEASQ